MPKSNNRKSTKIHCQHCAKLRLMNAFWAIDPKADDGKGTSLPFDLSKFLKIVRGDTMAKLPPFYAARCSECNQNTYYVGHNRKKTLEVLPY